MAGIFIKNLRLSKEGRQFLNNINLLVNYDENTVIVGKEDSDLKSCQYLVRILASNIKPTSGDIDFNKINDARLLLGYKNFENIFKKNIKVSELINTLIKTQKLSSQNLTEIDELKEMLNIESFINKSTNTLNHQQLFSLNLLTLLIVKPHLILIDNLNLHGSSRMHAAILSYLKEYCKQYKIRMVVASNEKYVTDILADRKLVISKTKIVSDSLIKRVKQSEDVEVDNKTKVFDLQDDILAVLNNKEPTKKFSQPTTSVKDLANEKEIIAQLTKALDDSFETIIEEDEEFDEEEDTTTLSSTSYTEDLLTTRYEEEPTTEELSKYNRPLNEKFTGSLEFEKEEMKNKTRRFNEDSKDVLEDIKISSQGSRIPTKQITKNLNQQINKNNLYTNDFLADLKETYTIRRELGQQIKSPDFTRLTPELQLRVFDNYERADQLIKENDPEGVYDPYKQETLDISRIKNEPKNNTVTKMIIEETIHTSNIDDEIEYTSTSRYETEEVNDNTLNNVIDNVSTNAYFDNEDDFNTNDYTVETTDDFKEDKTGDFEYIDNEKKNKPKKSSWRDRFVKKNVDKNISEEMYGKPRTTFTSSRLDDEDEEITDELKDFTKDLKNGEPTSKLTSSLNTSKFYTKEQTTDLFEDDDNDDTSEFQPTIKKPTRSFQRTSSSINDNKTRSTYQPPKTMAIKQRSKKNLIERLYDEALEDSEIIEEYRGKKNK